MCTVDTYLHDDSLTGRENKDNISAAGSLDVPWDAVPDAAVGRIDAKASAFAGLLMGFPTGRIYARGEGVLGHEIEMVVILRPVHITHFKGELQPGGGRLDHDRVVPG